ncbi:MAG TPA: hypothetical protein PKK67_11190 [Cyclobacteriaceae bacterium]|nr:hypothetical protein [Cyclobacteriaceae bacterium]
MKKHFLIFLIALVPFFASAQLTPVKTIVSRVTDSTTTIPSDWGAIRFNAQRTVPAWQFYNGSSWELLGGGSSYTFTNGLTESGGTVGLGGALANDVEIDGAYNFSYGNTTPLSSFNVNSDNVFFNNFYAATSTYNNYFNLVNFGSEIAVGSDWGMAFRYDHAGLGTFNMIHGITDGVSAEGFQIDDNGTIKFRIPRTGSNWILNLGSDADEDTYVRRGGYLKNTSWKRWRCSYCNFWIGWMGGTFGWFGVNNWLYFYNRWHFRQITYKWINCW